MELVSEPITPHAGTFDTRAMSRGEPGLPAGFHWREHSFTVVQCLRQWKESSREGGHAQGELYLRRHAYELLMSDGSTWSVYCVRQTPKSGNPKQRWFLYTRSP